MASLVHDRDMSAASVARFAVVAATAGLASGYGTRALLCSSRVTVSRWRTYVLIAVGAASAGAVTWRFADRGWLYPAYLLLAVAAVPLTAVDVVEHRIPDAIVKPSFVLAVALLGAEALHTHQAWPIVRAGMAAGAVYAAFLVLIISTEESMGWGDGKLLAFSALFLGYLGWERLLAGLLLTFAGAAIVAGGKALSGRRGARLPLAPFLLLGTLTAIIARR
ncbi:prepilin peptidase [Actinocrinis puniceicyclus]|uniref:Prepilin peptidase n=1 Tax=Actinocrinis puniceicyclus TaxID=977794 RepID=A0A8J7WV89_9ACTN|nr:A24 family peptidase [Actinocrinis puniceicyclus]MBS2966542.1 prepilin peptidase [Actinocrinis puniceicyclus]